MTPIALSVSPAPVTFGGANSPILKPLVPIYESVRVFETNHPEVKSPLLCAVAQLSDTKQKALGIDTDSDRYDPMVAQNVLSIGNPDQPSTRRERQLLNKLVHEVTKQVRDDQGISYRQAKQALFVQA